jgi:hypothetical protein
MKERVDMEERQDGAWALSGTILKWQEREDLNPRPTVLETAALPG